MPLARPALALLLAAAPVLCGCQAGDFEMPMTDAQEKEKDSAARVDYYESAALTYYDGGKYESAAQMWTKVLGERPDDQKAKWGLAKALQMIGTPQSLRQAEAILVEIIPLEWTHPEIGDRRHEVQGTLATTYQELAAYYDRDVRSIEERMARDPASDTPEMRQQLQVQVAMRNDLLAKSIPLWEAGLVRRGDNPYALAGLAKAYLMLGQDDQGIAYARRYIQVARSSQSGWRKMMSEYEKLVKGEMTQEARKRFVDNIQEARRNELKVHLLLGSVHMRREEYQMALDEFNAVLEIDPATPSALVERAQAYAKLGAYREAISDLETYLKLTDPERQRAARARAGELHDRYRRMAGLQPLLPAPAAR
ncbi:MAG: tetratricopeptide repeat protein [Planctomycetia bacterium]